MSPADSPAGTTSRPPAPRHRARRYAVGGTCLTVGLLLGLALAGPVAPLLSGGRPAIDTVTVIRVVVQITLVPHDTNSQPYPLEAVRLPHCAGAHFLNGGVHVYADQYDPATAVVGIVDYAYRDSFSGGGDDLNVSLLKPGEGLAIPFALSRGEHWAQIYAGPPPRYGASFPFEADGQAWTAIYPVYGVNNVIPPLNSSADGYTVRESHWVTTHENVPVYLEGRTPCM